MTEEQWRAAQDGHARRDFAIKLGTAITVMFTVWLGFSQAQDQRATIIEGARRDRLFQLQQAANAALTRLTSGSATPDERYVAVLDLGMLLDQLQNYGGVLTGGTLLASPEGLDEMEQRDAYLLGSKLRGALAAQLRRPPRPDDEPARHYMLRVYLESATPSDTLSIDAFDLSGLEELNRISALAGVRSARGTRFDGANLSRLTFRDSLDARGASFRDADLSEITLRHGTLSDVIATGASFAGATLDFVDFSRATLDSTTFASASGDSLILAEAKIRDATFTPTRINGPRVWVLDLSRSTCAEGVIQGAVGSPIYFYPRDHQTPDEAAEEVGDLFDPPRRYHLLQAPSPDEP